MQSTSIISSNSTGSGSSGGGGSISSVAEISERLELNLNFGNERSRTNIGPQGDHVSAYALMKMALLMVYLK